MKLAPALAALAVAPGPALADLDALPWSDLAARLTSAESLVAASAAAYVDECYPPFRDLPRDERTNHALIGQPSGLCVDHLFCAHAQCNPQPEFHANLVTAQENFMGSLMPFYADPPFSADDQAVLDGWLDSSNPSYNLPHTVIFPATAADVVAAVAFAKEHGLKVSVKNSGHSYAGSSTFRDSLLVNMNRYERYALTTDGEDATADEMGVEECAAAADGEATGLEGQPCRLALARGKPAVLRVGGGENFDKAYRAVKTFNEKNGDGYKYHMVGGAAGTVSPMGWTWMGGLAATTMGRTLGFGVDQVLQIEAVLPSGHHVRFGPTEWEDSEAYLVPKTTKVSGECMIDGEWSECPAEDGINFDDLWFAMRGGGGGAWGVVLSTHLQLHDHLPYELVDPGEACTGVRDVVALLAEFALDYLLDPGVLGVSAANSNACGLAAGFHVGRFDCFGDGVGQPIVDLWRDFVESRAVSLRDKGMTVEDVEAASNCLEVKIYNDYTETGFFTEGPYAGKVQDTGKPSYISDLSTQMNQLVPKEWMVGNKEFMVAWLTDNPSGGYFAFGGDADRVHDQTSSLSRGHREAGMMYIHTILDPENDNEKLLDQYDFTGETIPPYIGANHVGPNSYGPMKSDKTQPCPVWILTNEEVEQLCVPILEAVYGTETLARLESIKKAIDPDMTFDCYRCVGNKSLSTGEGESDPAADTGDAMDTGASDESDPVPDTGDALDTGASDPDTGDATDVEGASDDTGDATDTGASDPDTDASTEEGDGSSTATRIVALASTSALVVAAAIVGLF